MHHLYRVKKHNETIIIFEYMKDTGRIRRWQTNSESLFFQTLCPYEESATEFGVEGLHNILLLLITNRKYFIS